MKVQTWLKRAFSTLLVLGLLLSSAPTILVQRLGGSAKTNIAYAIPFVTATKWDRLVSDPDNDGLADPGDTIRYTTTITNSGTTNAADVLFSDTIDANTTLAPGSLQTTPIARNDLYFALGNVGITVPAGSGVLANDDDPDGSGGLSVVSFDATSANGGNVSIAADGGFTYNPPPGYEGSDSFGYVIQDGEGFQDPALVGIVVSDVIWFVDNAAAPGGDGRLGSPYNSLGAYAGAADDPGDVIYLYTGSGPYGGGITLQANQTLIGQGAGASIQAITGLTPPAFSSALPATGGVRPSIVNSSGAAITLASGSLVRGLAASSTNGSGLAGVGVNTLTVREVSVSNTTGNGIHLTNLSGTATFEDLSVIGSSTHNVLIENSAGTAIIGLTNSTINSAGSGDGFALIGTGSAGVTLNVTDSSFTHNNASQLKAHARGSSTVDANIIGNAFDGDPAVTGNVGVDLAVRDGAGLTFDVIGSGTNPQTFQPFRSQVINVYASGGGTASGRVNGNTVLGSTFGAGVRVVAQVTDVGGFDPDITVEVNGNTISNVQGGGLAGIHIEARDDTNGLSGTAEIDATVTNNDVTTNGADAAIQAFVSDLNGTANRVCINATGNSTEANGGVFGETDFFFGNDAEFGTVSGIAQMQGYASSVSNTWFNVNSNTTSTTPAPLALGLGPVVGGTCGTVAQSSPAAGSTLLARAGESAAGSGLRTLGTALSRIDVSAARLAAAEWAANLGTLAPSLGRATAYASGETINLDLGDLNPGQVVLIWFDVTLDATTPPGTTLVCNQGLFTGANFVDLLTDDPDIAGTADPTCTFVDIPTNTAPAADNDGYSTNEDTALVVAAPGVLDGDTDADGDPLTAVLDTGPSSGALTLNADGSFSYTPNVNYCGTDSFTYHANDGTDDSNVATVTIDVLCVNDAPVADNDGYTTLENTTLNVPAPGVLDGDTDVESDPLTAVLDSGPGAGTLTLNVDGSFTYVPDAYACGTDSFTYHANDGQAGSDVATVTIGVTCVNYLPLVLADQAVVTVDEGQTAANTGTVSDPDGDTVALSASYGSVIDKGNGTWSWSAPAGDGPRSETVTITGDDGNGGTSQASFGLKVLNVAPSIVAFLVPPDPISLLAAQLDSTVTFTDPVVLADAPYTCVIDYGDGSGTQHGLVDDDECSGSHTYTAPGVFALSVSITDNDGATGSDTYQYIVVYDPDGGFVTGGGWIDSPAGAYRAQPSLTGKASFGFVSKYVKGQSTPEGNTQFQFKTADIDFHSSSYDWLVVAGHKAMYKGTGTINGGGNYGFQLSAIDAAQTPSVEVDRFRIKIWDKDAGDAVVYDNQVACADTGDDADPCTEIGGGSIVIHTGKKK